MAVAAPHMAVVEPDVVVAAPHVAVAEAINCGELRYGA